MELYAVPGVVAAIARACEQYYSTKLVLSSLPGSVQGSSNISTHNVAERNMSQPRVDAHAAERRWTFWPNQLQAERECRKTERAQSGWSVVVTKLLSQLMVDSEISRANFVMRSYAVLRCDAEMAFCMSRRAAVALRSEFPCRNVIESD